MSRRDTASTDCATTGSTNCSKNEIGRSAAVTHIGALCRAAGFLPVAMPSSLRHQRTHVDPAPPTFATGC